MPILEQVINFRWHLVTLTHFLCQDFLTPSWPVGIFTGVILFHSWGGDCYHNWSGPPWREDHWVKGSCRQSGRYVPQSQASFCVPENRCQSSQRQTGHSIWGGQQAHRWRQCELFVPFRKPENNKLGTFVQELAKYDQECPPDVMESEDSLFLLYTSGSTGKPKGVVHSQAGYLLYVAMTHEVRER